MQTGLEFLGELEPDTRTWILSVGVERQLEPGQVLVQESRAGSSLSLVLTGTAVVSPALELADFPVLGPGDIVGDMAFLENEPHTATVAAAERLHVLDVSYADLHRKIARDPKFGQDLYRALARAAARRFRDRERHWYATPNEASDAAKLWRKIEPPLGRMKVLLQAGDHEALRQGSLSPQTKASILAAFHEAEYLANDLLGASSAWEPRVRDAVGARVQSELLPYVLMSSNGERWYSKPRGYAGDYLTIAWMYENDPRGTGRLGPVIDEALLEMAAPRAVRNRRAILAAEIRSTIRNCQDRPAHVTSLASGPAQEILDVASTASEAARLRATLVDIDPEALAYVRARCEMGRTPFQITLVEANLIHLATGRRRIDLAPQDLIYSIGLIDYFSDEFVINLMNLIYDLLKVGGRAILGNFHPRNVSKALMDYLVEWQLIHRTEDDLNRLYRSSKFGRPSTRVLFEAQGINLFAECFKT
jgi:hypothetical protein